MRKQALDTISLTISTIQCHRRPYIRFSCDHSLQGSSITPQQPTALDSNSELVTTMIMFSTAIIFLSAPSGAALFPLYEVDNHWQQISVNMCKICYIRFGDHFTVMRIYSPRFALLWNVDPTPNRVGSGRRLASALRTRTVSTPHS